VEHAVERFVAQRLGLRQQRPGARGDAQIGEQVRRRRRDVGQHQPRDLLAGEHAARKQRTREARADEAAATGDQQFHGDVS